MDVLNNFCLEFIDECVNRVLTEICNDLNKEIEVCKEHSQMEIYNYTREIQRMKAFDDAKGIVKSKVRKQKSKLNIKEGNKMCEAVREMLLSDTVEMMNSEDYKERFKAEYYQNKIRYGKLCYMLERWDDGTLDFKPTCKRFIYDIQIKHMKAYLEILETRAELEGINL